MAVTFSAGHRELQGIADHGSSVGVSSITDSRITFPPPSAVEAITLRIGMVARRQEVYFCWRPILPYSKDAMVLELAIALIPKRQIVKGDRPR